MIRSLLAFIGVGVAFLCATLVHSQPVVCPDDSFCNKGFYCNRETFNCSKCLSCEDLKRETPNSSSSCIRSVAECGPCTNGLVEDLRGDVSFVCVPPDTRTDEEGVQAYVWVAVVVGLILLAILVLVIVYLLRNTYTFKILASTRTSVQSPCGRSDASAPELPPPYDAASPAPYNPHYVAPSPPAPPRDAHTPVRDDDSSWPFIKRAPSERGVGEGAREAAGRQAARVFNYPRYVRAPHLPASYKGPCDDESESTFTVHDEDTMESTWSPAPSADHADTSGNAVTSGPLVPQPQAALHAPHSSHATHAPHETHAPHALCARQDSNNNRSPAESAAGGAAGSGAPSFIINVVQNINAVQQHNDVTL